VAFLEVALTLATNSFTARLARAIGGRLAGSDLSPETPAPRALEELRTALGAVAMLQVESESGVRRRRVASRAGMVRGGADAGALRVVLVKRSERHYTTTVSLGRNERLQFTPRDHAVMAAATELFDVWASSVCDCADTRRERRAAPRGFAGLLQCVALEGGSPVTVVVLLISEAASRPGLTRQWVAGIRRQLRICDVAGSFGQSEIGLLMHEAGPDQARGVAETFREVAGEEAGDQAIVVGITSRALGVGTGESSVKDARAVVVAGTRRRRLSESPYGVNR
jgi:hypothetical protein